MKIKKILSILIGIMAFLLVFSAKSEASQELNELTFEAQINEDGSMNVVETWDIYISETNTLFKTFEKDDSKYSEITNVTVTEITGNIDKEFKQISEEMYHVTKDCYYALTNSNGLFEIAWGVGLDDDSDTREYQISYTVKDAIAKYNDYSELYWKFVGDDFEIDADQIKGIIYLPKNATNKEDVRVWGHTKYLNGEIYVTDLNKIEFSVNRYWSGNYVEVRTLIPNHMIQTTGRQYNDNILNTVLAEEMKWSEEANERRKMAKNVQYIIAGVGVVFMLFFITRIFNNIKKLKKLEKKFKPTTQLEYFRELPYQEATPAEALFVFSSGMSKSFSESFSANILDLALKKFIMLEAFKQEGIFKSDIVKIAIENKDLDELKEDERLTLEFLKEVAGEKRVLTTEDITKYLEKNYSKVDKLNRKLEKIIEKEESSNGNYIKQNDKEMNKFAGICVVYGVFASFMIPIIITSIMFSKLLVIVTTAFMITLVINAVITGMMSAKINVFTQKGVDEKEKWKAFKKYMEDFSLLKEKEVPALVLWEKYLVFATVFGISEKVLKQLKVIYPEVTDVNSTLNTYSYIHIMNSVNIGDCINTSVYSAIASSGSGAGGGFSGGGGGGRRPVVAEADAKILI